MRRIDDALLIGALQECEGIIVGEQVGRSDAWPTAAAVACWQNAMTLRRLLATPHHP